MKVFELEANFIPYYFSLTNIIFAENTLEQLLAKAKIVFSNEQSSYLKIRSYFWKDTRDLIKINVLY
ncbi:MAG: hypothetical protein ACI4E1_10580 [Lachnospira sp.]